jgi:hypothetical protein
MATAAGGIRESQLHSTISTDGTPLGGGLAKIMMAKYRTGARRYADGTAEINHVSGICGSLCQSGAWAISEDQLFRKGAFCNKETT